MNTSQIISLATAGALAVFATRAASQLLGGKGGLLVEVAAAAGGIYLAGRLK